MKKTNKPQPNPELIYGYPKAIHELAVIYIHRDIYKCETMLIEALMDDGLKNGYTSESPTNQFTYDNVENIYYISPKWIADLSEEEQQLLKKHNLRTMEDFSDFMEADFGVDSDGNDIDISHDDLKIFDEMHDVWKHRDSEAQEVFEWWSVTNWLANQLMEIGEPVMVNDYGFWWGRTCTGQSIILDGTFQKIAERHIKPD